MTTLVNHTVARPSNRDVGPAKPASRAVGAFAGVMVAGAATLIALVAEAPFLALGIPAATVSGWWLGPAIRPSVSIVGPALKMATITVVVADAMFIVGSIVVNVIRVDPSGGSSITNMIGGSLFLFVVGLFIVGIPMLVVTVPCGFAWAALARRVARGRMPG